MRLYRILEASCMFDQSFISRVDFQTESNLYFLRFFCIFTLSSLSLLFEGDLAASIGVWWCNWERRNRAVIFLGLVHLCQSEQPFGMHPPLHFYGLSVWRVFTASSNGMLLEDKVIWVFQRDALVLNSLLASM